MMNDDRLDAFKGVSRKPGLQIWTVSVSLASDSLMSPRLFFCSSRLIGFHLLQKMKLVPISARTFGNFFEGDCYVVLNVSWIF